MYFDVNINSDFNKTDISALNNSEYTGFCINTTNQELITEFQTLTTKRIYKRTDMQLNKDTPFNPKSIPKCDIFGIKIEDDSMFKTCYSEWQPDIITYDFSRTIHFPIGLIRDAMFKNFYFEIPLKECLYENRINWIKNVQNLLEITKGRNTVISSCASISTEIKKTKDIKKMLGIFGLPEKRIIKMVEENSFKLLESCALKRYSFRGMVVNNVDEGNFKKDFLLGGL